jgi:flagellar hook-basal body complex protein FliE
LSCTYTGDPSISIPLNVVPTFQQNPPGPPVSYKTLPNKAIYQAEIDRFNNAIAITDAKIDKAIKLKTAFATLQDAENVRDKAPDAYQSARVTYYRLVKGDKWVEEEKARIANVEAQPVVDRIVRSYTDIQSKRDQQRSTLEVANGIRDKLLSVKGDLQYSVSAFQKQIREIKNQINMDKKKQIEIAKENNSWIDSLLNWLIAITTLVAIVVVVRQLTKSRVQSSDPSTMTPR